MVEIISAKLISYVKVDFSTEAEMELYINNDNNLANKWKNLFESLIKE